MKTVLVLGLAVLVSLMVIQVNSDFSEYDSSRTNLAKIVDPEDAYIGYSCGERVVVASCCNDCVSPVKRVLTVYNNMDEDVEVDVSFYGWSDSDSNPGNVEVVDGNFVLPKHSPHEVFARFSMYNANPGVYFAIFKIEATWSNGTAKIYTTTCPVEVEVVKPSVEKYLLDGKTTVKTHSLERWVFVIEVENKGNCSLTVKDVVPGEFNITSYTPSTGSVSVFEKGKSKHIFWKLRESGTLTVSIETSLNPSGKREFTSPGIYKLNDGAEIKGCGIRSDSITVEAVGES